MTRITVEISSYEVTLSREIGASIDGSDGAHYAQIVCRASDGHHYLIFFFVPGTNPLPNFYEPQIKRGATFLPHYLYPAYIDLLRNEKPVKFSLNSENPDANMLHTSMEPTGERDS